MLKDDMGYRFIEDIAIADIAFEASGKDINELFEYSAYALENTMVKDLKSIKHESTKEFKVNAKNLDILLVQFLDRLIFYKDTEQLVFAEVNVNVEKSGEGYEAHCSAMGETLDSERHSLLVDVKAVTMHMLYVRKEEETWKAMVVLDI
jgi:SHS2 domain-containing protein